MVLQMACMIALLVKVHSWHGAKDSVSTGILYKECTNDDRRVFVKYRVKILQSRIAV